MATVRVGKDIGLDIQEHIGLTSDTSTFLAGNTDFANGSTYRETDGTKRKYKILNGVWYQVDTIDNSALGQLGGKYISTTDATTPETGYVFLAIQVISDAVVTLVGTITGITAVSVTAGTVIYGRYTSVTLASGSVIAYNGV